MPGSPREVFGTGWWKFDPEVVDYGIDVNLQGLERSVWDQSNFTGQYNVTTPWSSFVLASGDAWPEIRGMHPEFYVASGEDFRALGGGNRSRITLLSIVGIATASLLVDLTYPLFDPRVRYR